MPADPGANLGWRKLRTKKKHIGHVAPSFKDPKRFNTLVIRSEYRISLRLGDIDKLFPWGSDTKAGRLARMQVLGLFYWPLNHRVAAGKTAKPAGKLRMADNQAAYKEAWKYFKEKFCGVAKASLNADPEAENNKGEAELEKRLKEWVLQKCDDKEAGSRYNTGGKTKGGGELPLAAEEDADGNPQLDEAQGHFAKIRLPGGYCFLKALSGHDPNEDTSIAGMGMYDEEYVHEDNCYKANPVLGKLPLIAKVEKLNPSTNEWKPAKNVWVHFQLLKSYDLPAFDSARAPHRQINRPELRETAFSVTHPNPMSLISGAGVKYFNDLWEDYNVDKKNPQGKNCHVDCGGKRKTGLQEDGSDVKDIIFKLGTVPGFSAVHEDPPANILDDGKGKRVLDPAPSLKPVKEVNDANHPHAVKAKTNGEGEAGAIFMPSRCAGDRYRLRAYIADDDKGFKSTGNDFKAVRADTGTFVIWRNIRVSRWARQPFTNLNQLNATMLGQATIPPDTGGSGANNRQRWMWNFGAVRRNTTNWRGLPGLVLNTVSDGKVGSPFDGLCTAFARGFCELDTDSGYEQDLTAAEWDAAVKCGLEDAKQVGVPALGNNVFDWDGLFFQEVGNADNVTVNNGFHFPARTAAAFSTHTGDTQLTGPHKAGWAGHVIRMISNYCLSGFLRHITKNGYLPGVTFVQGMISTNLAGEPDFGRLHYSGRACHFNGAFMWYGAAFWPATIGQAAGMGYGFTSNVSHEMGHVLLKVHAPGLSNGSPAGGMDVKRHDSNGHLTSNALQINSSTGNPIPGQFMGEPKYGTCIMSYRGNEGQYCSRCLFQLRGWKILSVQMKAGDAAPVGAVPQPPPPP